MYEDKQHNGELHNFDWHEVRLKSISPGGFGHERMRLWKALLNVSDADPNTPNDLAKNEALVPGVTEPVEEHEDERQIKLDTDRSFVLYPVDNLKEKELLQHELHKLIVEVFRKRRRLSYFQGYHDIISVLYLTLPKEVQFRSAEKLSLHRLRDSMGSSLEPVLALLRVLQRLLSAADLNYSELLASRTSPLPYYALSNLLTLFSHDMPTLSFCQHVFDYLLARPPIASVYLAAAVLLSRKAEVELLEQEGEDGMIHSLLSSLPDLFEENEPPTSSKLDALDDPVEEDTKDILSGLNSPMPNTSTEDSISTDPTVRDGSIANGVVLDVPDIDDPDKQGERKPDCLQDVIPSTQEHEPSHSESSHPHVVEDTPSRPSTPPSPAPRRPRISMTSLLQHADLLYELYPPSHPSISLHTIMGPQSVVFTWSENPCFLPSDDEAELMVGHPELVVLPVQEGEKEEDHRDEKRPRRRLRKSRRLIPLRRKTMVASAVLVLGVAVAVYGTGGFRGTGGDAHRHGHREWRSLTRFVGAVFVGAGERLLDTIWG